MKHKKIFVGATGTLAVVVVAVLGLSYQTTVDLSFINSAESIASTFEYELSTPNESAEHLANFETTKEVVDTDAPALMSDDPSVQAVSVTPNNSLRITILGDTVSETVQNYIDNSDVPVEYEFISERYQLYTVDTSSMNLLGGAPYMIGNTSTAIGYCSMGFPAFDNTGDKVIISAGHCVNTSPGNISGAMHGTNPRQQPAFGGSGSVNYSDLTLNIGGIGSWTFGEYGQTSGDASPLTCGGSTNITSTCLNANRADISAWKISETTSTWSFAPRVTKWLSPNPANNDLITNSVTVSGVSNPVGGSWVARSGRRTGWQEGTVTATYSQVQMCEDVSNASTCRTLPTFQTSASAGSGDSGGPFVQRNSAGQYVAVGILSGGGSGTTFATNIKQGLDLLKNRTGETYRILVAPPVATSLNVVKGDVDAKISGTAEPNSTVYVSPAGSSTFASFTTTASSTGAWSFLYSKMNGAEKFTAYSKTSYSQSDAYQFSVTELPTIRDGIYIIHSSVNYNKTLDVSGAGIFDGANVQIWTGNDTAAQKWRITNTNDGFYTIKNISSNTFLDVSGAGTYSGANVQIWTGNSSCAQKWQFTSEGSSYILRSACSNLVLDVSGGADSNGANVQIWNNNGTTAQKWQLQKIESQAIDAGTYIIVSAINLTSVVDVSGGSTANGANVQIWQNNGTTAQKWQFERDSDGIYRIKNTGSNKYLDVNNGDTANGANVQIWGGNGTYAQGWLVVPVDSGLYQIKNIKASKLLDVDGGKSLNGTNIKIWQSNGSAAQKWRLVKQ